MSAPSVDVNLIYPPSSTVLNLAPYLTQEVAGEITSSIELPSKTNSFAAPEVGLKGYDTRAGTVRAILLGMTPTSTNFQVQIWVDGLKTFDGYIVPNTVQFDPKEMSFSFTAVGLAAKLATVAADDASIPALAALQRSTVGWTVAASFEGANWLAIAGTGECPITSGDRIALVSAGKREEVDVTTTVFDGTYWQLYVAGLPGNYAPGTPVELVTPFLHNVLIQTAVNALFQGAGLAATDGSTFLADLFTSASGPFASPILTPPDTSSLSFALGGPRNGAASTHLRLYTSATIYEQAAPPIGSWSTFGANLSNRRVIDWTRYGANKNYYLQGVRSTMMRGIPTPDGWNGDTLEYRWYCYDYQLDGVPVFGPLATRYCLRVAVDNVAGPAGVWHYTRELLSQTTDDGYTWGTEVPLDYLSSTTTTADLHTLVKAFGIDIDVFEHVVYFSDLDALGDAVSFYGSAWDQTAATLRYTVADSVGAPHVYTQGYVGWWVSEGSTGGTMAIYQTTATGAALPFVISTGLPWDFQPFSIVTNYGENASGTVLYALSSSMQDGTHLLRFTSKTFAWNTYAAQLLGPGSLNGSSEMVALGATSTAGYGPWPMVAVIGNKPWWVATSFSGVIPYLDLSDMTCGDAMGALATLVNGYYYADGTGRSWFKSRARSSNVTIANPAGVNNMIIDDTGMISLTTQPRFENTFQFVRVENDKDPTIYGEAGEAGYRGGPLDLTIQNRFVPSPSYAAALGQEIVGYLGRDLRAVEVLHIDDGRFYELGYRFTCHVEGETGARTFQIISTTRPPLSSTVKVLGLEL